MRRRVYLLPLCGIGTSLGVGPTPARAEPMAKTPSFDRDPN